MNLYCSNCQKTHSYSLGQVERIVYTLQLAEYDSAIDPEDKERNWLDLMCLDSALSLAYDSEGYAEVINESLLPARQELTRL